MSCGHFNLSRYNKQEMRRWVWEFRVSINFRVALNFSLLFLLPLESACADITWIYTILMILLCESTALVEVTLVVSSLSLSPAFTVFDSVRRSMRAPLLFCFRLLRWKVKIFPGKKAIYRFFYLDSVNYGLFFSFWKTLFVSLGCLR